MKRFKSSISISIPAIFILLVVMISTAAQANYELDRRYALNSVGALKAWDNLDGLFAEHIRDLYKKYFESESRFILMDISKAQAVIDKSSAEYSKIIENEKVLSELARSMKVETLLRTKIYKEGPEYRVVLDWLHVPRMDLLATHTFSFTGPERGRVFTGEIIEKSFFSGLDRLFSSVPFKGQVTGRDGEWVTLNVGRNADLKKGDQLVVATLEDVKTHPILKTLVNWNLSRVGKVEVDEVDNKIAFCRIIDLEQSQEIGRYQKIVQIIPKPIEYEPGKDPHAPPIEVKDLSPSYGFAAGNLWLGGGTREFNNAGSGALGGGMLIGARAEGQLWITKDFFADLEFGYAFNKYSQKALNTSGAQDKDFAGTVSRFRLDVGYFYHLSSSMFGPKGWVKLGFKTNSYSYPLSTADNLDSIGFSSLFVGIGGDIPVSERVSLLMGFNFGLANSVSFEETLITSTPKSTTDFSFIFGGTYRFHQRISARFLIEFESSSADFENGLNVSQKSLSFLPAIIYYF